MHTIYKKWRSLLSPMSCSGICWIQTGMLEFHGILMESILLEPQPFWFSIPWKFWQNLMESRDLVRIQEPLGMGSIQIHWNSIQIPSESIGMWMEFPYSQKIWDLEFLVSSVCCLVAGHFWCELQIFMATCSHSTCSSPNTFAPTFPSSSSLFSTHCFG